MDTSIERRSVIKRARHNLRWSWRKYNAVLRVSIASNLAYVYEVLFRSLFLIVLMFVFGQLWKTTYTARGESLLGGFSMNDMIWYLAAAETIATSMPQLTRRIDEDVRSGRLAYLLGRPYNYVLYNFAQYLGERLVRFFINGVVAAAMALLLVGPPHFSLAGVLAWPLVTLVALCIDFAAYFGIGLLAFWTEDTNSFTIIYSRLALVLGGVLVPLEVFPQPLRGIAQALPFSAILYGPARTLVHFDVGRFGGLLLQQGITLAIGWLIVMAIYRVAIRRVNINGG
ncbi:MAG TPA: ABC-2 family transporter protein [Ktedonobacteraceae bacterium]|nr:ABC-2 family transporter protein [Ktedonobacteraceae bacterium]